ncbi:MAG: VCBS repeat-containing protein, partial [Acidobacteria bacterium]|nr:VCBS repeat-containing protein [Acidobacteriota bacterium]
MFLSPVASCLRAVAAVAVLTVLACTFAQFNPYAAARGARLNAMTSQPTACGMPRFGNNSDASGLVGNPIQDGLNEAVTADFDLDGRQDMVMLYGGSERGFNILLGFTNNRVVWRDKQPFPEFPQWLVKGDFNGDRRTDVLVITQQGELIVWTSNGNGKFARGGTVRLPEGHLGNLNDYLPTLHTADFNNDGRTDFAFTYLTTELNYRVFLGQTDGALRNGPNGVLMANGSLATGDWDGDNFADLVIAENNPGRILVASGKSDGTFGTAAEIYRAPSTITSVAIGSFERSDRNDIFFTTEQRNGGTANDLAADSYQVINLLNTRDASGAWVRRGVANLAERLRIRSLLDMTGDGRADLLLGTRRGERNGTALIVNAAGQMCTPVYSQSWGIANPLGDVNNDGKPDVIHRRFQNEYYVNFNEGVLSNDTPPKLTPLSAEYLVTQGASVQAALVRIEDFDPLLPGSCVHLETLNLPAGLQVTFENELCRAGTATLTATCALPVGSYQFTLKGTDLGGNSATANLKVTVTGPPGPPTIVSAPASIATREGTSVIVAVTEPNVTLPSGIQYVFRVTNEPNVQRTLLLDGVTVTPAVTGTADPKTAYYYLNASAGTHQLQFTANIFCARVTRTVPLTVVGASETCRYPAFTSARVIEPGFFSKLTLGDFNGDGFNDVAALHTFPREMRIFLAQADGTLRQVSTAEAPLDPDSIIAADFTRDGKLDLAICSPYFIENPANQGLTLLAGDGAGNFRRVLRTNTGSGVMTTGDFNRDSHPDLLVHTLLPSTPINPSGSSFLTVLLNDGKGEFTTKQTFNAGAPALGYLNDDNLLDLIASGNPMTAFIGNADGTFTSAPNLLPSPGAAGRYEV